MPTVSIQQAMQIALEYHRSGRLSEAETIYWQILKHLPDNAPALHLLGLIAYQTANHELALELVNQAIKSNPATAEFHNTLGDIYRSLGRVSEAVTAYRRATELKGDYADAFNSLGFILTEQGAVQEAAHCWTKVLESRPNDFNAYNNLGLVLDKLGQPAAAMECYSRAIALQPASPEPYNNMGNSLRAQGRLDEAVSNYRRAIQLKGGYPEAQSNLAVALSAQGKIEEAFECWREAIRLKPNFVEAYIGYGNVLESAGRLDEAIAAVRKAIDLRPDNGVTYNNLCAMFAKRGRVDEAIAAGRKALGLKPDYVEAFNNLGSALLAAGKYDEAIASYQQALTLRPGHASAHYNLGNALGDLGQLDQALMCYRRAIELSPQLAEAHNNAGFVMAKQGRIDESLECYRRAVQLQPGNSQFGCNILFTILYHAGYDEQMVRAEHEKWAQRHAESLTAAARPFINDPTAERKLRIGYVSPDFRTHPVSFFIDPVLAAHDRKSFTVICYADVARPDAVTHRLETKADLWRNIAGLSDVQAADLVREDRIDILVDLAGHTAKSRMLVFARKPAPVQVTCIGYPGTTGMTAMDYKITDVWADPPGAEVFYTEKLVRLPHTFWCFEPDPASPAVGAPPARKNGYVTFGSFNNLVKISPQVVELWSKILGAVPSSRLLINAMGLGDESTRQYVRGLFAGQGIDPERLELLGWHNLPEHLRLFNRADLALDPFPFTGGTTTCHTLWMGVPLVTLAGKTLVSRMGVSALTNVGLTELIAATPQEYVKIAVELAGDLPRLAEMRRGLRQRMKDSPLTDRAAFIGDFEEALRQCWRRWCGA